MNKFFRKLFGLRPKVIRVKGSIPVKDFITALRKAAVEADKELGI